MTRAWYACCFALAVLALGAGGLFAFRGLQSSADAARVAGAATAVAWPQDTVPAGAFVPIEPNPDDYAQYEDEDAAWRQRNAHQFTLSELRARVGRERTPQEALRDRVYEFTRRGDGERAIAELEGWLARRPGDEQALLSLARLLNETGRNADAIKRYRQLLAAMDRDGSD